MDLQLTNFMNDRVAGVSTQFHRYMYSRVSWNRQMMGLTGLTY